MKRTLFLALPALTLAVALAIPAESYAQFGRGGRGGGWGGGRSGFGVSVGNGGVSFGTGGYGYGYPGYGYGGWGSGYGYGYPGYGYGGNGISIGLGNRGYGYGSGYYSSPGYYSSSPGFYSSSPGYYVDSGYSSSTLASGDVNSGYQSFYPPADQGYQSVQQGSYQQQGQQQRDPNRAYIHVMVPPQAEVMFEGTPTQQRGPNRMFQTPPLEQGHNYSYTITARWQDQNGREMTRTRKVSLQPGQTQNVSFMQQGQGNDQGDQQFQPGQRRFDDDQQFQNNRNNLDVNNPQRSNVNPNLDLNNNRNNLDLNNNRNNTNPGLNPNPGSTTNPPRPNTSPGLNPNPGSTTNPGSTNPQRQSSQPAPE